MLSSCSGKAYLTKMTPNIFESVNGSSTMHALVELLHNCYNSTDASGNFVRVLLLDYSKALNLINHQMVLQKRRPSLTARQQRVRIGGSSSPAVWRCPSRYPLGCNLFVVHMNNLEFECQCSKYVDDANIIHISSDPTSTTLPNDADTAYVCPSQNDMIIYAIKAKELRIDFIKSRVTFSQLFIANSPIAVVSQSKILGVIIRDDLKWNQHGEYITKTVQRSLWGEILIHKIRSRALCDFIAIYHDKGVFNA